jgi:ribosomal-protein-alanine N-acetyltransferase
MDLPTDTDRIAFRLVTPDHASDYHAMMADPEMGRHTDIPCQPSEKQAASFVAWMARLNANNKGRAWALTHEGQVVGFMRLNRIDRRDLVATVGYELARPFWGRGLVTEALMSVVRHAHGPLNVHRLEATVFNGNPASARVLLKAGFQHEGVQRSRQIHRRERRDLCLFGRLATD